jgi:hypothetical protein
LRKLRNREKLRKRDWGKEWEKLLRRTYKDKKRWILPMLSLKKTPKNKKSFKPILKPSKIKIYRSSKSYKSNWGLLRIRRMKTNKRSKLRCREWKKSKDACSVWRPSMNANLNGKASKAFLSKNRILQRQLSQKKNDA